MDNKITPFFNIVIPTWEYNGKGAEYLNYSLSILYQQTFSDFSVVVTDHSQDNEVKNIVSYWKEYIPIKYIKHDNGRGKIAPNLNYALKHCQKGKYQGKYIKILFQDDFLYNEHSLMKHWEYLDKNPETKWLVTACAHTKDMETVFDPYYPKYHEKIYEGDNTISCPSVLTLKNDETLLYFDESLEWLVDVDYYKRCKDTFGLPAILNDICVINRDSEIRTTNILTEQRKVKEVELMKEKYGKVVA